MTGRHGASTTAMLAAALLVSCASTPSNSERAWAAGDLASAKAAYELTLANPKEPAHDLALLRLAIIQLATEDGVHGEDSARAFLDELLASFPQSPQRFEARTLVAFIDARAAARKRVAELEEQATRLADQVRTQQTSGKAKDSQLEKLTSRQAECQTELRRVRLELDQLKRIDLQRRP